MDWLFVWPQRGNICELRSGHRSHPSCWLCVGVKLTLGCWNKIFLEHRRMGENANPVFLPPPSPLKFCLIQNLSLYHQQRKKWEHEILWSFTSTCHLLGDFGVQLCGEPALIHLYHGPLVTGRPRESSACADPREKKTQWAKPSFPFSCSITITFLHAKSCSLSQPIWGI